MFKRILIASSQDSQARCSHSYSFKDGDQPLELQFRLPKVVGKFSIPMALCNQNGKIFEKKLIPFEQIRKRKPISLSNGSSLMYELTEHECLEKIDTNQAASECEENCSGLRSISSSENAAPSSGPAGGVHKSQRGEPPEQ